MHNLSCINSAYNVTDEPSRFLKGVSPLKYLYTYTKTTA